MRPDFDMNKSLMDWYTRRGKDADLGRPSSGVATRETREILLQMMTPLEWWHIEEAAHYGMTTASAEFHREAAGYMCDAPDLIL